MSLFQDKLLLPTLLLIASGSRVFDQRWNFISDIWQWHGLEMKFPECWYRAMTLSSPRFWECEMFSSLTLFRMGIFGAAYGWGGQKGLHKICHTYPTMMKVGSYTLAKEDSKNVWITWHTPWVLLTSAFFHRKSADFVIWRNKYLDCILVHNF